jgi:hypothetical protein
MSPERRRLAALAAVISGLAASVLPLSHGWPDAYRIAALTAVAAAEVGLLAALARLSRREGCVPVWQRWRR